MEVLVEGSGGSSGWPEPGCRCASCGRMAAGGSWRQRSTIVVGGMLRLGAHGEPQDGEAQDGEAQDGEAQDGGTDGGTDSGQAQDGGTDGWEAQDGEGIIAGFRVRRLADAWERGRLGGWDVTSPEGERLLYPAGPGAMPDPPAGAARYDVAFLDLVGNPAQLGGLRARGLVTADTITAVAFADHRVPAVAELERRCGFWRVGAPGDGERITTDRSAKGFKDQSRPWRVLLIGGARSGKSEQAELRLAGEPEVTYVATAPDWPGGAGDAEWAARVAAHQARRPAWWRTVETTDLAGVLAAARGAVLIDGIGTWLAAVLDECGAWDGPSGGRSGAAGRVAARTAELVEAWRQAPGYVVAVSDEAGLGVVPATAAGRVFRDELGRLNQALAAESEETELIVAGRVLPLPPW
jgi:adenosylcobinamide kinase / adenosylcobinamide-phosphate guanylyltransferase